MNVLGLFSGIGGFELGLVRAGFTIKAMCECEAYPRAVLAKQFSGVPIYDDVRTLTAKRLAADDIAVDVVTGGFPCQDISLAGKGAGLSGARSGLWWEMHRIISEVRPAWVIAENVSALRSRGLDEVLGSLAAIGYDAEWHCIPASAVGAPHRRDRIWIMAYPARNDDRICNASAMQRQEPESRNGGVSIDVADANQHAWRQGRSSDAAQEQGRRDVDRSCVGSDVADAIGAGLEGRAILAGYLAAELASAQRSSTLSEADSESAGRSAITRRECGQWLAEPDVGRMANGVPSRVDRLRALGNAVVPQIPEIIGRAIMSVSMRRLVDL